MAARKTERNKPKNTERTKLVKIGALWISEGKQGKFMSGRIQLDDDTEIRVLVFKNGYKEQAKHPDYVIYEPGEQTRSERSNDPITDDDVPF